MPKIKIVLICLSLSALDAGCTRGSWRADAPATRGLSSGAAATSPSIPTSLNAPAFGVNTHLFRGNDPTQPITTDRQSAMFTALNARVARLEIPWAALETTAGNFDFTAVAAQDQLIKAWRARGIRPILILDYGNPLYTGAWNSPPRTATQLTAWGRYCAAVARHWVGADLIFEVWNEPNLPTYWANGSGPSAAEYVALLDAATAAIRTAQPTAYVITGGLSPSGGEPMAFLQFVLSHADTSRINGVGYHPYTTGDWAPWDPSGFNVTDANAAFRPESFVATHAAIRALLKQNNLTKDIHVTEVGYPLTFVQNQSPARQATLTARLLLSALMTDASSVVIYDLVNDGTNPTDPESTLGLFDFNFVRKPSGDAFATFTGWLAGATSVAQKSNDGLYEITLGHADGSKVVVAWTTDVNPRTYAISAPNTGSTPVARDIFNADVARIFDGKTLSLSFTQDTGPVVIRFN